MTNQTTANTSWPPKIPVCVGAVVLKDNQVLLVRQAKGHDLEDQWSIPWGLVDPGESPEVASMRETQEEAGIIAQVEALLGLQNLNQEGWIGLIFLCRHVSGEPTADAIETDAAAYFSLADMDSFNEPFEPWSEWLVRRVLRQEHYRIPIKLDNPYQPRLAFL